MTPLRVDCRIEPFLAVGGPTMLSRDEPHRAAGARKAGSVRIRSDNIHDAVPPLDGDSELAFERETRRHSLDAFTHLRSASAASCDFYA